MMDDRIDATFHGSTSNGITFQAETVILHFGLADLKIARRIANVGRASDRIPVQGLQAEHDIFDAAMPQLIQGPPAYWRVWGVPSPKAALATFHRRSLACDQSTICTA